MGRVLGTYITRSLTAGGKAGLLAECVRKVENQQPMDVFPDIVRDKYAVAFDAEGDTRKYKDAAMFAEDCERNDFDAVHCHGIIDSVRSDAKKTAGVSGQTSRKRAWKSGPVGLVAGVGQRIIRSRSSKRSDRSAKSAKPKAPQTSQTDTAPRWRPKSVGRDPSEPRSVLSEN